jgi:hypothetical protein
MDKLMKAIEGLEDKINNLKDLAEDYIKSLSIYDQLQDKIEEVKYSKNKIKSMIVFIYFIMIIICS